MGNLGNEKIGKLFKDARFKVETFDKGEVIAMISDPFGKVEHKLKAPNNGYIINVNDASIVYQGDAVFHISTKLEA